MKEKKLTSYPSIDKPQYKFYRKSPIRDIKAEQTIYELAFEPNKNNMYRLSTVLYSSMSVHLYPYYLSDYCHNMQTYCFQVCLALWKRTHQHSKTYPSQGRNNGFANNRNLFRCSIKSAGGQFCH